MERLILTQAWNQENLKDGLLNSSFFLCASRERRRPRRCAWARLEAA